MNSKTDAGIVYLKGRTCSHCGGPLFTPRISGERNPPLKMPEVGRLCATCVALVLCRMTIIIHGDVDGDSAKNNNHDGSELRIAHNNQAAIINNSTGRIKNDMVCD